MKNGWKTLAIGRHLIDVPNSSKLIQQWKYDGDRLEMLGFMKSHELETVLSRRESLLRSQPHTLHDSMFIERIAFSNGSATVLSWSRPNSENGILLDTYFRTGSKVIRYQNDVMLSKRKIATDFLFRCNEKWREFDENSLPDGVGFVVENEILADDFLNPESWDLVIRLANKPDVALRVRAFAQDAPEPSLRTRAGGILAGMLGMANGLVRLRNRERPVGPIWAEEILVAGTQDGKRCYGFKWEAPGKGRSLAEPQINISLEVSENAYRTNAQSFANDEEALALWDTLVDSIRLRPGAV